MLIVTSILAIVHIQEVKKYTFVYMKYANRQYGNDAKGAYNGISRILKEIYGIY